mmetsp:Transcript_379/g.800  ORF Transcript_379/g.800 Transcript_379/m.800 type:complete len:2158 (-) Transcript_379:142-6615(-)
MGCGPSKAANAAVEPFNNEPGAIPHPSTFNTTTKSKVVSIPNTAANTAANGKSHYVNGTVGSIPNGTTTEDQTTSSSIPDDPQWQELWLAHKDMLLDPADVHATLQDLMATCTNRFSDVELVFLQRRIRSIVRQSHLQSEQQLGGNSNKKKKNTRRTSGSDHSNPLQELLETHGVAKNHHLLTAHVLRKILPQPPVPSISSNLEFLSQFGETSNSSSDNTVDLPLANKQSKVSTLETTYLLALFCNDALWDNVAEIAVDSAKANNLDMDVNHLVTNEKQQKTRQLPVPSEPTCDRTPERPLGMGMHALTFILGLALRGSRQQQLNLLFYILLPPDVLESFLINHPAGGVPTWLLEVGQESVISLASLSHYYWYGGGTTNSPFLPSAKIRKGKSPSWNKKQQDLALKISTSDAIHFLLSILVPEANAIVDNDPLTPTNEGIEVSSPKDENTNSPRSPAAANGRVNSFGFRRKNSAGNQNKNGSKEYPNISENGSFSIDDSETQQTDVLDRLKFQQQQSSKQASTSEKINFLDDYCTEKSRMIFAGQAANWMKEHDSSTMTILEFEEFCENTLEDGCISALMHRLYGQGWIPNPSMERDMVRARWIEWQESSDGLAAWSNSVDQSADGAMEILSENVRRILDSTNDDENLACDELNEKTSNPRKVFGGLGGFDNKGGTGCGVMYCVDKKWWKDWEAYVDWSWAGDSNVVSPRNDVSTRYDIQRPGELSTEILLNRHDDVVAAGTLGSYELMKKGLKKDIDYVLLPPAVWDVLYEMYAGGPPIPRMVTPPESKGGSRKTEGATENAIELSSVGAVFDEDPDINSMPTETDLDAMATSLNDTKDRVLRIPRLMEVITHPWVLQFQLSDPLQPYRKLDYNEAGPVTIRVMASPDQPFWRLYSEVIARLPFHIYRSYGPDGRGKVRLWKRIDPSGPKDRYGPWPCTLLCKNRHAFLPRFNSEIERKQNFEELKSNWEEYADNATVAGLGLTDESQLLVEFAVMNLNNELTWPREAAAKAGRVRRLADKDMRFRRMLLGLNEHGAPMANPPELVGMTVDAVEEKTRRWYEVRITHVKVIDPDTDEENDDDSIDDYPGQSYKEVRVDFSKFGGRAEWIRIPTEFERLATAGRFTMGKGDPLPATPTKQGPVSPTASNESKTKVQAQVKTKTVSDTTENTKVCTIPGYGACGLSNLGNTCYINSALQCISYFPMLRSYLLSGEFKTTGDLNIDNPLGTGGLLLEQFVELLRFMWSAKAGEKSPFQFRKLIAKLKPDVFAGADQQDAQELLSYVLDALMEDSNRVIKKPYVEGLEDDWVKTTALPRVGEEAWRRERRRSRSIITDVHTGQTLSTTTCPKCNFASQKFDPFNLLSVPLPTVTDVIFKCYVVRRANAFNTPWVLNRAKSKSAKGKVRFTSSEPAISKPPSDKLIVEQYIISMSRLADINDLRLKVQSVCGIPATKLIICSAEEKHASKEKDDGSVVRRKTDLTDLTNQKGPCSQFARQRNANGESSSSPASLALLVAFEATLRSRPIEARVGDESEFSYGDFDDEDDTDNLSDAPNTKEQVELENTIMQYGNPEECRLYDTETLPIAQAVSRSIWPKRDEELKLGLRVDAIDHKKQWYPGSVIEITESADENCEESSTKVRIHFDNTSSKYDETYTIEDFNSGQVRPLYSHATPRTKPTQFIVHHRYMDRSTRIPHLFGMSFYVQCHSEWSTARAGAQILAQASRFLRQSLTYAGPVDVDGASERETKINRLYERTQTIISELIDLLVEGDREYIHGALGFTKESSSGRRFRNSSFDATPISSTLIKLVNERLHKLPFEVRVCNAESPIPGPSSEEIAFPFSLMRTIGNYLGPKHAIVLQWREPPSDKKMAGSLPPNSKYSNYLGAPVMYVPPKVVVDEVSAEILTKANQKAKKTQSGRGSAGMPLGKCLTEFCKIQKLEDDEGDAHWRCPRCKDFIPGAKQSLVLWRLPDILTIHLKRFRSSQKWREKISTKVNFPLTGLDMRKWCHKESPVHHDSYSGDSYVYDLIGVLNHYGGMTGGHYVATCKATPCSKDGREEVAYDFNGVGTTMPIATEGEADAPTGWKAFGRQKVEINENKVAAEAVSKFQGDSVEPLWLQFDDEVVEPVPPKNVLSESAYVLFYRRRRLTPANVARYSSLE